MSMRRVVLATPCHLNVASQIHAHGECSRCKNSDRVCFIRRCGNLRPSCTATVPLESFALGLNDGPLFAMLVQHKITKGSTSRVYG